MNLPSLTRSISTLTFATIATFLLSGCSKPPPKSEQDKNAVIGTWLEFRPPEGEAMTGRGVDPGQFSAKTPNLRKIEMKQDGTFEMQVVAPDGKRVGTQAVSGTWSWSKKYEIAFVNTTNTLDESLKTGAPLASWGTQKRELAGKGETECFILIDESTNPLPFTRVQ